MKVVVTHSGLQHANHLAQALYECDNLLHLITGMPLVGDDRCSPLAGMFGNRVKSTPIPMSLRSHYPVFPLLERTATKFLPNRISKAVSHRLDHVFDSFVAGQVERFRPDVVVCYENAARLTFKAARRVGAVCVLDAASIHYRAANSVYGSDLESDPEWVNAQKKAEIESANAILTCSDFAGETYISAGVPASKVHSCWLGTELPVQKRAASPEKAPLRLIYIGTLMRRKGADILLDVVEQLSRNELDLTLTIVGGIAEADLAERARTLPAVTLERFTPKPALFDLIARHDCLVLPSRFDSFGMVVPEAMAVGVPAMVSDRVGAKMIIEQHRDAGWVVPLSRAAWAEAIREIAANRSRLRGAGAAARIAARDFTWTAYRQRVTSLLRAIYEGVHASATGVARIDAA